jgi:hypothetical protein
MFGTGPFAGFTWSLNPACDSYPHGMRTACNPRNLLATRMCGGSGSYVWNCLSRAQAVGSPEHVEPLRTVPAFELAILRAIHHSKCP